MFERLFGGQEMDPASPSASRRPVPDRQVPGPPLRLGAADRPRDVGLQGLRRGRHAVHADVGPVQGAAAQAVHDRHPLRDPLDEARHRLGGRPDPGDPRAAPRSGRGDPRRSPLRSRATPRTCRCRCSTTTTSSSPTRSTASRSSPSTATRSGSSSRSATSGRAPSGSAASSSSTTTSLGFWERYGYNNDADPWKEERFSE